MEIFIGLLFIAALPIILVFVFLELNSEKQLESGSPVNDGQRKLAKVLGWGVFVALIIFLIYSITDANGRLHLRGIFKLIGLIFHFLA